MKNCQFLIILIYFTSSSCSLEQEEEVLIEPALWREISAFQEERELMLNDPKYEFSIDNRENKRYFLNKMDQFSFMQPEMLYWDDSTGK